MPIMIDGITVHILGDFGPFSRMGKSIGYQVEIGDFICLVDCGAPLFQQIGGHKLKNINGIIVTHCHDDHKRWFSDLALFNLYAPDVHHRVSLLTSEDIHNGIVRASMPALEKSLSADSKTVVDIPYEAYVSPLMLGPKARYRIVARDEGNGRTGLCITDGSGAVLPPDRAKIVISLKTKTPRMLFKDPECGEWVEPESFYAYSSDLFYEAEKNIFRGPGGFTIEAVKAPVWHGIAGIGIRIKTGKETLVFSSDTVHDTELWKQLYTEKRARKSVMTDKEFDAAPVIYGDINDYIERTWSEARYLAAVSAFQDAVVIHDISAGNSIVHTDYEKLGNTVLEKDKTLLTHGPDRLTSEWTLCYSGKTFRISGRRFFEVVDGELCPMNADIYHKEAGKYFVGYRNERGKHAVYSNKGRLRFSSEDGTALGEPLYRVDLYEDIAGKYFPELEQENAMYRKRPDGKVEILETLSEGSRGRLVENRRKMPGDPASPAPPIK